MPGEMASGLGFPKEGWQIAAAVDDALDADRIARETEQDEVSADDGKPRPFADLRAEPVEERPLGDCENLLPDLLEKRDCAPGIVFRNEMGDGFEIAFDEAGEFYAHS